MLLAVAISFVVFGNSATAADNIRTKSYREQLRLAARAALGPRGERRETSKTQWDTQTAITRPAKLLWLSFGPVLVTTTDVKNAGDANAGSLGVYYLKPSGDGFRLVRKWTDLVVGNPMGLAPEEWSLTRDFTRWPALYVHTFWNGQGYGCRFVGLYELRPAGLREVGGFMTYLSHENENGKSDLVLRTNVQNLRNERSFEVRARGTKRFVEHYQWRGDGFRRVEKKSPLQC